MANTTKLTIEIESLLKGLNKTLSGLARIKKSLQSVANVQASQKSAQATNRAATASLKLQIQQQRLANLQQQLNNLQQRGTVITQRTAIAQQRLAVQHQNVANAQTRANQATQRLAAAQTRLNQGAARGVSTHTSLNRVFARLGNSMRSIGQGLASFGAVLSVSVSAPLAALGASIVNAAVRLDSLERGLRTIAGSSQEAAVQMERLTRIAKLPGIGFEEAIQGSIRLQAVGFGAREAEKALIQFSNAIALTGGGREQLENVTVQLGQMAAQSKVLAQDLKPIISSAPAVALVLREAFGTVRSEELQELGISSKQFIDTLVDGLERLPRASAGARNSFENFRDELFRAAATVGTTLLPALTRLAEVAGPIITTLANAFAALPAPLQVIVTAFGGLAIALGPVSFLVGQLTLGVGRLLVGFGQLNVAGILPTIASLRALTAGTLSAAAAQRTLAASTVLVGGAFATILTALAAAVTTLVIYKAFQKDSITLSREQVDALTDQIKGLKEQVKFIDDLKEGVERTADEQQRLLDIYSQLNTQAKVRVTGISDEEKRLAALREEIAKIIALREQERLQQAASIVGELANNLLKIKANEDERNSIAARIQENAELIKTLEREQKITVETTKALAARAINAGTVQDAIGALKVDSQQLSDAQDALIASGKELNDLAKDEVTIVRALERQTGLTARGLLVVARNMGEFRGDVAAMIPVLEAYIKKTDEATKSTDAFNRSMSEEERRLNEAGKSADELRKRRQTVISSAAALAREASDSFEGALKFMRAFIAANPELRAALERESQITGKSFEESVREALESAFSGRDKSKAGTSLRNAQQQLQEALRDIALAESEAEVEIEKAKAERLLKAAEVGQRLRIVSLREFLELRSQLNAASLDAEIKQQEKVVESARAAQARLAGEAAKVGIPEQESLRRQAQSAKAQQEAIEAEAKLEQLRAQRGAVETELAQDLKLAQDEQLQSVRQLEIEYAQLRDQIAGALKAETVETFRVQLEELGTAQKFLNEEINEAVRGGNKEREISLKQEAALNQRKVESILNQIRLRDALADVAGAEAVIERAKQRQADLEDQIRNDVELRGLTEDQAIQRRLAGELQVREALVRQRDEVEKVALALFDAGLTVPKALNEFIAQADLVIDRLGKLTFTEQFDIAERRFNQINDERLRRIAEVEIAVQRRDRSDIEGTLRIRQINREYVEELRERLAVLEEIAKRSNDANLIQQAEQLRQEIAAATAELSGFNQQLRSTAIDALHEGFTEFFVSLTDRTKTAKEKLLDLINSVTARINQVIAEKLSEQLIESLFGGGEAAGEGLIARIGRFFGFGRGEGKAGVEGVAGGVGAAAGEATEGIAAATALTTGATTAATALITGGTTAATTLVAALTTAATAFATVVTTAGAAFAATVAAGGAAQGLSGGLGSLLGGAAATGMFPAVPGGAVHIVEGGFPEAVLTTDPRHALRQVGILREFLKHTKGLQGRIPGFARGGFDVGEINVSRETAEMNLLDSIHRAPSSLGRLPDGALAGGGGVSSVTLRQIFVDDQRDIANFMNSAEGDQVQIQWLSRNRTRVQRLLGVRPS